MGKTEKLKKFTLNLFIIFMITQPLFDIFWLYDDNLISIFKFSPATIIRMLIMCILFFTTFIWYKNKNKYKYLITAIVIYVLYAILHHINSSAFYVPYGNFDNYLFIKEIFYMIRMLCPLLMIVVIYEKKISYEIFKKIIISVCLIFSLIMILSNFFKFALTSYNGGTQQIDANFFEWFISDTYQTYSYLNIASKGIFHMANQVSGTLICLLPLIIVAFMQDKKIIYGITIFTTIFAMIMLGTRVASLGWLAILIFMLLAYLFFCFVKKDLKFDVKIVISLVAFMIIFCIILPFSPVMNRNYITDSAETVEENIEQSNEDLNTEETRNLFSSASNSSLTELEQDELKQEKVDFVEQLYVTYGFDKEYCQIIYPYSEDPDFWIEQMDIAFEKRANHRQLKTAITQRIISLNNNKFDYILGISFTRLRNAPCYMENDIYVHIYSLGIFGIALFIAPYFAILIYGIYKVFKNFKNQFTFLNITLLLSISLTFIAGILSGNVFDEWICTLFLGFICGFLLLNLNTNNNIER